MRTFAQNRNWHTVGVGDGSEREGDLSDDLMALGEPEPRSRAAQAIKWRDFSLLRWIGLTLLIVGASLLFSRSWWVGILIGFAGLVMLWNDNEKLRRRRDVHGD